nr:hypothetical protein F58E2.7 - Caenorhabditis elegans [Caenorhabditis elegans]
MNSTIETFFSSLVSKENDTFWFWFYNILGSVYFLGHLFYVYVFNAIRDADTKDPLFAIMNHIFKAIRIASVLLLLIFITLIQLGLQNFKKEDLTKDGSAPTFSDFLDHPAILIFLVISVIISFICGISIYIIAQVYHIFIFLLSVQSFMVWFFPKLGPKMRKIHRSITKKAIHFYWILFLLQALYTFIEPFYQLISYSLNPPVKELADWEKVYTVCFFPVLANIMHLAVLIFGRKRAISTYQSSLQKYVLWLTSFGGAASLVGILVNFLNFSTF